MLLLARFHAITTINQVIILYTHTHTESMRERGGRPWSLVWRCRWRYMVKPNPEIGGSEQMMPRLRGQRAGTSSWTKPPALQSPFMVGSNSRNQSSRNMWETINWQRDRVASIHIHTSSVGSTKHYNRGVSGGQILLEIHKEGGVVSQSLCAAQISSVTAIAVRSLSISPKWNRLPIKPMLHFIF